MASHWKTLGINVGQENKQLETNKDGDGKIWAPLRIAQVAPLWTRVPPATYGGAELMVHWLTETLVEMGHEVTLFASADSTTSARLVSVCDENLIDKMEKGTAYTYDYYAIENMVEAMRRRQQFDVIHNHAGAAMIAIASACPVPVVHTVHAGLDSPDEHWLLERYPDAMVAAISHSQVSTVNITRRENIPVIYHSCDLQQYQPKYEPGEYLGFIGRMSNNKNPVTAIEVARKLDQPLVLIGTPQTHSEEVYFDTRIAPLIDEKRVQYYGAVDQQRKIDFLRDASVILFPIQWEEHFGLVMIEAMACGTPVVALKRGSVPEVIDPGVTGFFTDNPDELPELVLRAQDLDRHQVRQHAEQRFSLSRMARDYLELYRQLVTDYRNTSRTNT
jgi:glycosyltransferase involved in cell wall biosynthesis